MSAIKVIAWMAGLLVIVALLFLSGKALALSSGGYNLSWWTADGGGETSSSGGYSLGGTAGQPDGGALTGGSYSLAGGFWSGGSAPAPQHVIYLPVVVRQFP